MLILATNNQATKMSNEKFKDLTELQTKYYNERVDFFKNMGVAIPYGFIYGEAIKLSDTECINHLSDVGIEVTITINIK